MDKAQDKKVVMTLDKVTLIVPGEDEHSIVYFGATGSVKLSNTSLQAILSNEQIDILEVSEPQIEGVTDADIKDESEPVKLEDVIDENEVERSEDVVVEGVEDLTTK
ncbi:UNVERIFIED_CONTAM: hypothetical protein RF648_21315 [Kocuria sp. CPCC 205274]